MDSISAKLPTKKVIPLELPVINFGGIDAIEGVKENNWILVNDQKVLGVLDNNKFYGSHKYGLTTVGGFVSGCEALACVSGSLHKTTVISWLRIINDKLKLK